MVNEFGYLEDDDLESQAQEEDQSQVGDLFTPGGRRDTLRRIFGDYADTSSYEEGLRAQCPVEDEQVSPPRPTDPQSPQDNPDEEGLSVRLLRMISLRTIS